MTVSLFDVNFLIALAWPNHMQHNAAHTWFAEHADKGWATCPLTENGFVRISSNQRIISDAVSPSEAIDVLCAITAHRGHQFWSDNISICYDSAVSRTMIIGHRQVTDAYLLCLAHQRGGRLVTFDRGISQLVAPQTSQAEAILLVR
jgi:uncharacterized protein